jgi:NAD(P)H-dependent FMN reductase
MSDVPPRILAFAGSVREGSYNRMLAREAAGIAAEAGAEVTLADLSDYPMPLMNEDLEASEGMPPRAGAFKALLAGHDGFLIASPEYNGFVTPLLKNALDWASRGESPDEPALSAFRGKTAAILSASPGNLGGLRGLWVLRILLSGLGVVVVPEQHAVGGAHDTFGEDGRLSGGRNRRAVKRAVEALVALTASMKNGGG